MKHTNLIPIVDADFIVYRVGFAVKDDEPIENALSTTRTIIHNIWDRFPDSPEEGKLYISGKDNFRDLMVAHEATFAKAPKLYKGNRDPSMRPHYYDEIREYMIHVHGAITVNGMEAEDAAGIEHYAHKDRSTVLVHQDKDLDCLPGWHWNPIKGDDVRYITMKEANVNFWKQVLTGDKVDNIRGIDGLGPKTADKLIDPCDNDWLKMRAVALEQYKKQYGDTAEAILDETCRLVWILRKTGETYDGSTVGATLVP